MTKLGKNQLIYTMNDLP